MVLGALALCPSAFAWSDGGRQLALDWPAEGRLNSPFGWDAGRPHAGLDIGVLRSLDVRAAESGLVTRVGWVPGYEGYGLIVEVQLNERYSTLYAHLSRATVKPGRSSPPASASGSPVAPAGARGRTSTSSSATATGRSIRCR